MYSPKVTKNPLYSGILISLNLGSKSIANSIKSRILKYCKTSSLIFLASSFEPLINASKASSMLIIRLMSGFEVWYFLNAGK